jgi:RimJ/RimL family protein N-acetyltransferase
MDVRFVPAAFSDIAPFVRGHHAVLPSPVDAFLEDHIINSRHYQIEVAGEMAGVASIHGQSLITQFAMVGPHRRYGQDAFRELRRLEKVSAAFVPTNDAFYLSHALDDYRQLRKQAFFFVHGRVAPETTPQERYALTPATAADAASIRQEAGEFFSHLDEEIAAGQIFITRRHDEPVGYGVLVRATLYDDVASIGMFTREAFRNQGVGTATIELLVAECVTRNLRPVAGCSYYNHASKRTLERAGMVSPTRLLKIAF